MNAETWNSIQEIIGNLYKEKKQVNKFWHYSSLNGVLGMFDSYIKKNESKITKCDMWASNIRFMNDSHEYRDGLKFLNERRKKDGIDDDRQISDNIYLTSFCEEGDLLSQWKWYGKNSGVSICFNMDAVSFRTYKRVDVKDKDEDGVLWDTNTRPLKVQYTEHEKVIYYNKLSKRSSIADAQVIGSVFIPFCKDEGFKEEKEHRLVFFVCDDLPKGPCGERFDFDYVYNKNEEGRTKPALNVHMKYFDSSKLEDDSLSLCENIVTEMIVGPGVNQELVFNCLIHAFDRTEYSYQSLKKDESNDLILEEEFLKMSPDSQVHWVLFSNKGSEIPCYKCQNGMIIRTSKIPFRG